MNIIIQELAEPTTVNVENVVNEVTITIEEIQGLPGKSQYQSYLDTTTDNPPLSEAEWSENRYISLETSNW